MNSSAKELLVAVDDLTGKDGPQSCSGLGFASQDASYIVEKTENVNQSLSDAWNKASDVFNQLDEKINEVMRTLHDYMSQFSYDTIDEEAKVTEATEEANQTGEDIISELDDIHI